MIVMVIKSILDKEV